MTFYTLDKNKKVVPCSIDEWMHHVEHVNCVARDTIKDYDVSTVFLGLYQGYSFTENPLLFETMIFENDSHESHASYQTRCSTYEQALEMHQIAIDWIKINHKEKEAK